VDPVRGGFWLSRKNPSSAPVSRVRSLQCLRCRAPQPGRARKALDLGRLEEHWSKGPLGDAAAAAAPTLRRGSSSAAGFTHGWRRRPSFRRPFARPFLRHIEAATSPIAVALQQMLVLNDNFIVTFKADHKTNMYT
jgi:hypothetical protein